MLKRHVANDAEIGIFDTGIARQFAPYTRKELRAMEPGYMKRVLSGIGMRAEVLSLGDIQERLGEPGANITLIHDDISRGLVAATDSINAAVSFETPFLRWDRNNAAISQDVQPHRVVTGVEFDAIFKELYERAGQSSDWWRHVAAAVTAADGRLLAMEHNTGMPTEQTVNMESDPRILANRGSDIELSLFLHAEAGCIAHAAKNGESLAGSSIYVTTFPCPNCAKMIAASGIGKMYFTEGYAMLDGQRVLDANDVEIIKVETAEQPGIAPERLVPYPEK